MYELEINFAQIDNKKFNSQPVNSNSNGIDTPYSSKDDERDLSVMHNFKIIVCNRKSANGSDVEKFVKYCREVLPKKKGAILHVILNSVILKSNKQIVFQILNEIDKLNISVKTIKRAK